MTYFVYIIYSQSRDKFYIGSTENIDRRIDDHNNSRSTFTKGGAPWILKYYESFDSKTLALKREMEIKKKKSRRYLEWLISQQTEISPS